MSKELKIKEDGTFMANGNKYQRYDWLPIDYLMWYQYFAFHVEQGYSLSTFMDKMNEAWDKYDLDGKRATYDATVYNLRKGVKMAYAENEDPALFMASLIYCKVGDDRTIWDKNIANSYIKDWKLEGFDSASFFPQASKELIKLSGNLKRSLDGTSEEAITEDQIKVMDKKMTKSRSKKKKKS